MRRTVLLIFAISLIAMAAGVFAQDTSFNDLRAADNAWSDGNYIGALTAYIRLLSSPAGDQYLEPIALQTGELYESEELNADGRNPKLSPDGRYIAYETGPAKTTVTRIQRTEAGHATVAELPGTGAVFSPNGSKVAYLKTGTSEELTKAQEALDKLTEQGPERTFAQQTLTRLQSKLSRIVLRDLNSNAETEMKTGDLLKTSTLAFGADNESVYFAGAPENETKRNDIYVITASASAPGIITDSEGFKTAPILGASGKAMIVTLPTQTPFPVPQRPSANEGPGQRVNAAEAAEVAVAERRRALESWISRRTS